MFRRCMVVAVAVVLVAGCGGGDQIADVDTISGGEGQTPDSVPSSGAATPATEQPTAPSGEASEAVSESTPATSGDCTPGPGKKVTELDDVVIPAVDQPEVLIDDVELAGQTVPGFVVPGVNIPEQVIDAGCIIEYDAPGGCLGAVEITGFEIPDVEIPGFEVPAVSVGDTPFEGKVYEDVHEDGSSAGAVRGEQQCQRKPDDGGGYIDLVYRDEVYRDTGLRDLAYRDAVYRPPICVGEECTDPVSVPEITIPAVEVAAVTVEADTIEAETLEGTDAQVFVDEDQTAFLAPADVLFDFDKSKLRSDAVPTLRAMVAEIEAKFAGAAIEVEGHTDSVGGDDYNQRLSQDRADAVAQWLTADGGIASDLISTEAFGETVPVAPNTKDDGSDNPKGRAKNRRVVITVDQAQ
jgi:outer membrane protein OmpA-like peptidoglycan-associated protein